MSAWILAFYFLLHFLGSSRADQDFTDELLFNENIEPFQNAELFDPTTSTTPFLISDANLNGDNSDLLASDDGFRSMVDSTLIADCAPPINEFQGKKGRLRRQNSCTNPNAGSVPDLSLPTLDSVGGEPGNENPRRPRTPAERKAAGQMNDLTLGGSAVGKLFNYAADGCISSNKICGSSNAADYRYMSGSSGLVILYNSKNGTFF